MGADFAAFKTFLDRQQDLLHGALVIPRSDLDASTKNFLIFDATLFLPGSKEEKDVRQQLKDFFTRDPDKVKELHRIEGKTPEQYADNFIERMQNPSLANNGGGGAHVGSGILYFDSFATNLHTQISQFTGKIEDKNSIAEGQFDRFVSYHEGAHLMLEVKEAGADFMATALMLQKYPNSRDTLESVADLRNLQWMSDMNDNDGTEHGSECHDAIQYALHMSPEELHGMSVNDLHNIAIRFDRETMDNNITLNNGEKAVAEEFKKSGLKGSFEKALENIFLPEDSPGNTLLDSMRESIDRLKAPVQARTP